MIKTKFKDLFIIQNKRFIDKRGYFKELLQEKIRKEIESNVVYRLNFY